MPSSPNPQSTTTLEKVPIWLWPHVLSLEAPIVAVVWALALARLHQEGWLPGVLPGLALCVWTIYVADRTLDGLTMPVQKLDVRHIYYRRYRVALLAVILPACIACLVWLALWVIPAGLMRQSLTIGMLVALYLAIYATRDRRGWNLLLVGAACIGALALLQAMPLVPPFKMVASVVVTLLLGLLLFRKIHEFFVNTVPKEAAGGLLFALGSSAWVRFVASGSGSGSLIGGALETMLLTALFTCNLTGITDRELEIEDPTSARSRNHPTLLVFVGLLCAAVLYGAAHGSVPNRLVPEAWAVGGGVILLTILNHQRKNFSAEAYRALADIAVLVPALALMMVRV